MIQTVQVPTAGQRIGVVCGPGEFAADNAGIVLTQVETRWGTYALVMMDSGETRRCEQINRGPGIGWHLV